MEEELRLGESQGHKTSLWCWLPHLSDTRTFYSLLLACFLGNGEVWGLGDSRSISSPHSACRPKAQPGSGHRGSRGGEGKGLQAEPRGEFGLALPLQFWRILSWDLRGTCHVLELARACVLLVTLAKLLWATLTAIMGFCFLT